MLTAEEVVAQAAAEGLELETSRFASGYKGVTPDGARYQARVLRAGELVHLGSYVTAEEAALAVARTPEARAQVARSKAVPFTAEEVVAQAAAEGLKLETSNFASGYKGVIYKAHTDKYEARVRRAGKQVYLGCFVTPEEAALTIARACPAASPRPAALTAQEAVAQAAAEGLKLEPASNVELGYRGVCYNVESSRYHATVTRAGKHVHLGYFVTAEEAALTIARANARNDPPAGTPRPAAKRAAPTPRPPPAKQSRNSAAPAGPPPGRGGRGGRLVEVVDDYEEYAEGEDGAEVAEGAEGLEGAVGAEDAEEDEDGDEELVGKQQRVYGQEQSDAAKAAVCQAEAEGLTLQPSDDNATGYRCVYIDRNEALAKPFLAVVWRGKRVHLGYFATAEEAALAYARTPEAQAEVANPKPAPLTARDALAQAAAEGLKLSPNKSTSGYKGVRLVNARYKAYGWRAGKQAYLGGFVTAEEAALAVARVGARNEPPAASHRAKKLSSR